MSRPEHIAPPEIVGDNRHGRHKRIKAKSRKSRRLTDAFYIIVLRRRWSKKVHWQVSV
jgi:hypothetical protein